MMYKIEIVELLENDTKYPTENKVYEQKISNLDIEKVALFLNTKHNFQALPKNEIFLGKKECVFKNDDCEICPRGSHEIKEVEAKNCIRDYELLGCVCGKCN